MKTTIKPTLFLLLITLLAHMSGAESANAQATSDNTIFERLWILPLSGNNIDMDFDSDNEVHVVIATNNFKPGTTLLYMFRRFGSWFYLEIDNAPWTLQAPSIQEPRISVQDDGHIRIVYLNRGKLEYVILDGDRNITRMPGLDLHMRGLNLVKDRNGQPVISFLNRHVIYSAPEDTGYFGTAQFDGTEWSYSFIDEIEEPDEPVYANPLIQTYTYLYYDSEDRLNAFFYREELREFVWATEQAEGWEISDTIQPFAPASERFWSMDVKVDREGKLHACYTYDRDARYITNVNGVLEDQRAGFGGFGSRCKITLNGDGVPVVFSQSQGALGIHTYPFGFENTIAAQGGAQTPLAAGTDDSGSVHLITQHQHHNNLTYISGENIDRGLFTGFRTLYRETARFKNLHSSEDRFHLFFTAFEPRSHIDENDRIITEYLPVRDVMITSPSVSEFSIDGSERPPDNRRIYNRVELGHDLFVKLDHDRYEYQDVGSHRLFAYNNSYLSHSEDGINWTESHSIEGLRIQIPKLVHALDKFWLFDTSGYYMSADGVSWSRQGDMPDLFNPEDVIRFDGAITIGDRIYLMVHNTGRYDSSDNSCLVCPTGRSGQYLLVFREQNGWQVQRIIDELAYKGFVKDGDELVNIGVGSTKRSSDGINWTSEPNNIERLPGQVVKTDAFFFMLDQREYNWSNRQMNGYLRISRDGLYWQTVSFQDRLVSEARYQLAATSDRVLMVHKENGEIFEWGEAINLHADDTRFLPYENLNTEPEDNLIFTGRWQSVPGFATSVWNNFEAEIVASHYPDLYGIFAATRRLHFNVWRRGLIYWNGFEWLDLTIGEMSNLHVYNDGERTRLIAKVVTNLHPRGRLMAWDGNGWTNIGGNDFDLSVFAITTWNYNGKPHLVVSGLGTPAANEFLRIWDGETWTSFSGRSYEHRLPAGTLTTAMHDGIEYLYAAGNLMEIDGVPVGRIARYDGTSWQALQGGMNGEPVNVTTVRTGEDDIIIYSGYFGMAGNEFEMIVNGLVAYDGQNWTKFEHEIEGAAIRSLETYKTTQGWVLFASGPPYLDEGETLSGIGAYNGLEWIELDKGMNNVVNDMTIFHDGGGPVLYAIGRFSRAGDIAVNGIAKIPLYLEGRRLRNEVVNLTEGEGQLIPFPEAGLSLQGNVNNPGWLGVSMIEVVPELENIPDQFLGAANMMWDFETESAQIEQIILSTEIPDAESMFGGILGKYSLAASVNLEDAMAWIMRSDDGWEVLGGVLANNQLVSVVPTNNLTRAGIGLLREPYDVSTVNDEVPLEFSLSQNYPNPFNPSTTIRFHLPESAAARLEVYDILGRRVGTLVNENLSAGVHAVAFDGSMLASGLYLYRLQAGNHVAVRKMLLMK